MSNKYYGNSIPNTLFTVRGGGEFGLGKYAGSYHIALYDVGTAGYNVAVYSSVLPVIAQLTSLDEVDMFLSDSKLKMIMSVLHGIQDEFVSAGVVYVWMYKDGNFDEKVGGFVYKVSGRYRIEELEPHLIRVINDLYQNTYSQYYLNEFSFITEDITVTKCYGTVLTGLYLANFMLPGSPMKGED